MICGMQSKRTGDGRHYSGRSGLITAAGSVSSSTKASVNEGMSSSCPVCDLERPWITLGHRRDAEGRHRRLASVGIRIPDVNDDLVSVLTTNEILKPDIRHEEVKDRGLSEWQDR